MTRSTQRFVLAAAVLTLGAAIAAALIVFKIPPENEPVLTVALGFVLAWGSGAVNYYFGTSESSAQKSEIMAAMQETPQPVEVTNTPRNPVPVDELPHPAFGDDQ